MQTPGIVPNTDTGGKIVALSEARALAEMNAGMQSGSTAPVQKSEIPTAPKTFMPNGGSLGSGVDLGALAVLQKQSRESKTVLFLVIGLIALVLVKGK